MTRAPELDFDDARYASELNPTIVYRLEREQWLSAQSAN